MCVASSSLGRIYARREESPLDGFPVRDAASHEPLELGPVRAEHRSSLLVQWIVHVGILHASHHTLSLLANKNTHVHIQWAIARAGTQFH